MANPPMTEEIWSILLSGLLSLENNDDTMSGNPTADARKGIEWLEQQEWVGE